MAKFFSIVRDGKLIPEEKWKESIQSMRNDFDNLETNNERAKRKVAEAVENAVKARVSDRFGILFSGGIDSSLIAFIAKKLGCNFCCYTVGLENSDDIEWAKKVAAEYNFNLKYRILKIEELESVLKEVAGVLNDADIVKVSVGSVLYAAGKLALSSGDNILFGGLGSEELFAGYQRHEEAMRKGHEALHDECWSGLMNMWGRDLTRDFAIASRLGLQLRAPFLDKELIKTAMQVHPMLKLDGENKKIILREAAEFLGMKKEFAWRKKQAAQYGSSFVNGIEKLARKNGFKFKKDYLQSLLKR